MARNEPIQYMIGGTCGLFGLAFLVVGFQFIGQTLQEDGPINRALGPQGLPVMAKVTARTQTYPLITTVQYVVPAHNGLPPLNGQCQILQDQVVTQTPIGAQLAFRVDPQNPDFVVRTGTSKPWTWSKVAGSVVAMLIGGLLLLFALALYVSR